MSINLQNETVFASKLVWRTTNDNCSGVGPPKKWCDCLIWSSTNKLATKVQGDKSELLGTHIHYVLCLTTPISDYKYFITRLRLWRKNWVSFCLLT